MRFYPHTPVKWPTIKLTMALNVTIALIKKNKIKGGVGSWLKSILTAAAIVTIIPTAIRIAQIIIILFFLLSKWWREGIWTPHLAFSTFSCLLSPARHIIRLRKSVFFYIHCVHQWGRFWLLSLRPATFSLSYIYIIYYFY